MTLNITAKARVLIGLNRYLAIVLVALVPGFPSSPPVFLPTATYSTGGYDAVFPNGGGPPWVAVGDLNRDGKIDLVVANWCDVFANPCIHSSVGVLLGNGDGSFQPVVTYDSGDYHAFLVLAADVNGDGKMDLLVANGCADIPSGCPSNGSVGVLLGNGDGNFQPVRNYSTAGSATWMTLADFNGDGKPDLVVANCAGALALCPFGNGEVGVLLNNGDGTFQPVVSYDSGGLQADFVLAVDLNEDHIPDLLVLNSKVCNNCLGNISVLLGRGDGTFQPPQSYSSGLFGPGFARAFDLNGDGALDLVVTEETGGGGQLTVLLGRGDGTFQPSTVYGTGGLYATPLEIADVNGDHKPDLLVLNGGCVRSSIGGQSCLGVLLGNGDGTFQPSVTYDTGAIGAWQFALADLDGDGELDAIIANQCTVKCTTAPSTITVLASNGDGTFQPPVLYPAGGSATVWVEAADLNGDGQPDVIAADANGLAGLFGVLLNNSGRGPHAPTSTSVVSSANPTSPDLPVTYTATVTTQSGGVATGTIAFEDGGRIIATATITGNQATLTRRYPQIGQHEITATYSGDPHNSSSKSAALTELIRGGSKTVITTSHTPSTVGAVVTFTATVTSGRGNIPDGESVTFYDGTVAIGTGATAGGAAVLQTSSLSAKEHIIKASYPGDVSFKPSSGGVTQVVKKQATATSLTSSPNPSRSGEVTVFTAHVSSAFSTPTGKVKFMDGTLATGTATLIHGLAILRKSNLSLGAHSITATYQGDTISGTSSSAILNQVVE